jgi:phosphoribosyl-AMP cyclohydrolase
LKAVNVEEIDFAKSGGLVPVIAQDYSTKKVLMVAFANELALKETLKTGYAHYWSRSRSKLWMKGEESGHLQKIRKVLVDCDSDTILYLVDQKGPACHTNKPTCFHNYIPLTRRNNRK